MVDGEAVTLEAGGWIFPLSPRRLHVLHDGFGAIAGFCGISTSHNKEPIKFTPFPFHAPHLTDSIFLTLEYLSIWTLVRQECISKILNHTFQPGHNKNDNPLKR